jgi:hypothetical protein
VAWKGRIAKAFAKRIDRFPHRGVCETPCEIIANQRVPVQLLVQCETGHLVGLRLCYMARRTNAAAVMRRHELALRPELLLPFSEGHLVRHEAEPTRCAAPQPLEEVAGSLGRRVEPVPPVGS